MVTNGLIDEFRVIAANLLKPHSTAKWMIKNRNVRLTAALFSLPYLVLTLIMVFLPSREYLISVLIGMVLAALLTNAYIAIISLIVSATSGKVFGQHLDFAYVFCAFGSAMLIIAPIMIISLPVALLSFLEPMLIILYWIIIIPIMPCSFTQVVLSFTLFGINKNRLITGLAIYMMAQALIGGLFVFAAMSALSNMFNDIIYGAMMSAW